MNPRFFSLEELKDLSKISVTDLVSALQAQEQRKLLTEEEVIESALQIRYKEKALVVRGEKSLLESILKKIRIKRKIFQSVESIKELVTRRVIASLKEKHHY